MKIKSSAKIELAVSTDATRIAIHNVLIDRYQEKTVAVATNGRMIAVVPCEIENDAELGLVSPDALKQARKIAGKHMESNLALNGDIALTNGVRMPRPAQNEVGNYPNWKQVIPDQTVAPKFRIAFSAKYLYELAQALGACDGYQDFVNLSMQGELSPIIVTTGKTPGAIGVLMPARLS